MLRRPTGGVAARNDETDRIDVAPRIPRRHGAQPRSFLLSNISNKPDHPEFESLFADEQKQGRASNPQSGALRPSALAKRPGESDAPRHDEVIETDQARRPEEHTYELQSLMRIW